MSNIYAVVVTFNAMRWIDRCLSSLTSMDHPVSVIVVDNGSSDGTQERIQGMYPEVRFIQSETNLGFGKANNVGIRIALQNGAGFVVLLNQDAYFVKISLPGIVDQFFSNPRVGIISPIHLAGDKRNFDFKFYDYMRPDRTPLLLGDLFAKSLQPLYESQFVNAAAWIVKAEVLEKIGFFHPLFDHYGEDMEFVSRLKKNGYILAVDAQSLVVHDRLQGRQESKYFLYGESLKRKLLHKLIEGELTLSKASVLYLRVIIINIISLRFKNAIRLGNGWLWIIRKGQALKKMDKSSYTYSSNAR
jgi:N-acetylglucosaminyl-diphospho-decaprenol L-rhamnosyltransferase